MIRAVVVFLLVAALLALGVGAAGVGGNPPPIGAGPDAVRIWWSDESPPEVDLVAPAGPVSGTVRIGVRVRDRRPTRLVEVSLDGQTRPIADPVVIDTTVLPDGPHRVSVTAVDQSRRRNLGTGTVTFVSDNTPPRVELHLRPERVNQGRATVVDVRGDVPPGSLAVAIDGRPAELYPDRDSAWAVWGIAPAQAPDPLVVSALAVDEAGNRTIVTRPLTVTVYDFPVERIDAPPDVAAGLSEEIVRAEGAAFEALTRHYRPEKLWNGPFGRPVRAPVSSEFGTRRAYNVAAPGPHHGGTDFAAGLGTPVTAAAAGVVVLAETQKVRGRVVAIDHGLGVFSAYFHLNALAVEVGQRIDPGDRIGTVGTTGLSTGPHLHWEVRVRGVPVDPLEWTERPIP